MSKLQTVATVAKVTLIAGMVSAVAYGAFVAGSYYTASRWEKMALAYQCGRIDLKTMSYAWNDPLVMGEIEVFEPKKAVKK